jgi:hydroxymethylpyrimidine pyrophosphatase-like HAD family hydrolase
MRIHALASDYDGTLATHGHVGSDVVAALKAYRSTGRKLLLVTGRRLDELLSVFPHAGLFDLIVAENGALLYRPATREEEVLADPPPAAFVAELQRRGVGPIEVGRVIVATWEPHEVVALEVIRDMELDLQVILNKGAVMILPTDVSKATGLAHALAELGVSPHNTVSVGDAENDHALLMAAEWGVAVANAVEALKLQADVVTEGDHGGGVIELINQILADDLASWTPRLKRHAAQIGVDRRDQPFQVSAASGRYRLIAQSRETLFEWLATFLRELSRAGYQWTLLADVDTSPLADSGVVPESTPAMHSVDDAIAALADPRCCPVIDFSQTPPAARPAATLAAIRKLGDYWKSHGRPHWVVCADAGSLLAGVPRLDESGPLGFGILLAHAEAAELPLIGFDAVTYHEVADDAANPAKHAASAIRFRRSAEGLQFDAPASSAAKEQPKAVEKAR